MTKLKPYQRRLDFYREVTSFCVEPKTFIEIEEHTELCKTYAIRRFLSDLINSGHLVCLHEAITVQESIYQTLEQFKKVTTFEEFKLELDPKVRKQIKSEVNPVRVIRFNDSTTESMRLQKLIQQQDNLIHQDNARKIFKSKVAIQSSNSII